MLILWYLRAWLLTYYSLIHVFGNMICIMVYDTVHRDNYILLYVDLTIIFKISKSLSVMVIGSICKIKHIISVLLEILAIFVQCCIAYHLAGASKFYVIFVMCIGVSQYLKHWSESCDKHCQRTLVWSDVAALGLSSDWLRRKLSTCLIA